MVMGRTQREVDRIMHTVEATSMHVTGDTKQVQQKHRITLKSVSYSVIDEPLIAASQALVLARHWLGSPPALTHALVLRTFSSSHWSKMPTSSRRLSYPEHQVTQRKNRCTGE